MTRTERYGYWRRGFGVLSLAAAGLLVAAAVEIPGAIVEAAQQRTAVPAAVKKQGGWVGVASNGEKVVIDETSATSATPVTAPRKPNWVAKSPNVEPPKAVAAQPAPPNGTEITETIEVEVIPEITPEVKPETDTTPVVEPSVEPAIEPADDNADTETLPNEVVIDESLMPTPLPIPAEPIDDEATTEQENSEEVADETGDTDETMDGEYADDDERIDSDLLVDGARVGDIHSAVKVQMLYDEIMAGLQNRGITERYGRWLNYARSTIRSTNGTNTGSELDGRSRLNWYKEMYADPIKSVIDVDRFSRDIHDAMSGNHLQIAEGMRMIRQKLDARTKGDSEGVLPEVTTPGEALQAVVRALTEAQAGHTQAFATLTRDEMTTLSTNLYDVFAKSAVSGHTIPSRTQGRQLIDIMRKVDVSGFCRAAEALSLLTDSAILEQLAFIDDSKFTKTMLGGLPFLRITTPAGDILVGGRENKILDLDSHDFTNVVCIINRGGNNIYREGSTNLARPLLVIIDLDGNDAYTGTKPGIQGGTIMGISAIIDAAGSNSYTASDVAQGSALCGVGLLFDLAEQKTRYKAFRRVQGHALVGIGVAVDRGGDDEYRAALWAQGIGASGGFGLLENVKGNDWYYCGGQFLDSYPEHPGYDGWGQGIGAGIRQVANGGIGVILDGAGDDLYEVDYFGHGGGYWMGLGFARDFGGNDKRLGTTRLAYNGQPRSQKEWTRFANGWGCHYSLGYLFDDGGDDLYGGTIMGTGMAWDLSIGFLLSLNGNDTYTATGGMTQGVGAEGSIGILMSYGGNDTFMGRGQGNAGGSVTYHPPGTCGGNFSFVVNYGGEDKYGSNVPNNAYSQRGSNSGFVIDRPFHDEYDRHLTAAQKSATAAKEKYSAELAQLETSKEGKNQQQQRAIQMQITRLTQQFQKTQVLPQKSTIGAVTRLGKEHLPQASAPGFATTPSASRSGTFDQPAIRK